jgi:hypothetical protein
MRARAKLATAIVTVAAVLLAARAALPSVVRRYVNDRLARLDAYEASIGDVDLHLWRGAYRIHALRVVKKGSQRPRPFFSGEALDLSIEWRSLLRGSLVGEAIFLRPQLDLVKAEREEGSQLGRGEDWGARIDELFPFRFNSIRVVDGRVAFTAPGIQSADAITAEHVEARLTNLTNVVESGREAFAKFEAAGRVLGDAPLRVRGSLDPFAQQPTFDVNLELAQVRLPRVNPWLREYIKADAESGDFQLYLEIAAADGDFKGYAKPILRDVNIYSSEEPEKNPLKRLWEGIVDLAANVFENEREEQVAARIPLRGTIDDPEASTWETIVSVLRNAFVSAFARSLEGSISLRDVEKNLASVGKEASGKKRKEEKKEKEGERGENEGEGAARAENSSESAAVENEERVSRNE